MPRGRLIFPFAVDLGLLDTSATEADPDGAGPLDVGFDDTFREPVMVPPSTGSQRGTVNREETVVQAQAQIEPETFDAIEMVESGRNADAMVRLVFHFRELEQLGFVDANGNPTLRIAMRLIAIRHYRSKALIQRIVNPPGLFATQVQPRGFGIGPHRNLLLVTFEERAQGGDGT